MTRISEFGIVSPKFSAEKRQGVVADGHGPEDFKVGLVGDGLEKMAEDDDPFFFEDTALFYDLERVSFVEEAVGRVEKDEVKGRLFLGELDDRPVELFVHDPAPVFRFASRQVKLD